MKLLTIISPEENVKNETDIVNEFFEEGLQIFHLRKSWTNVIQYKKYLEGIKPTFLSKISLHLNNHSIHSSMQLNRFHIKENQRLSHGEQTYQLMAQDGFHLSTSIHRTDSLDTLLPFWNYVFLSPVSESISKPGYKNDELTRLTFKRGRSKHRIIALGGITPQNAANILKRGYDGVAVLGAIWNNQRHELDTFKSLQKICGE